MLGMFGGPDFLAGLHLDDAGDAEEVFGANKTCQPYTLEDTQRSRKF